MSGPRTELGDWLTAFVRDAAFLEKYPYYAAILARITPVLDPSVKRMAVSLHEGRFYLHVNVQSFIDEPQHVRGVLLHEVHHVALGHLGHPRFAEADEPAMMELAIEMSANEHIEEPLPDPILWQHYAPIGVRAGQSTLERYDLLVAAMRAGAGGERPRDAGETADDHRFLRRTQEGPGAVEHARKLVADAVEQALRDDPRTDDEPRRRRLLAGRDPGRLLEELTGALGEADAFVDYRTALRMFVARARAPVHTYARPNRRFPGRVGEIPGRTYSPRVIARPHLLVAIDTSMSMEPEELAEIARQLARLSEHARITVAECDVEVTRVYPFTGAVASVLGRGGTDLRPIFEPALLGGLGVDGAVCFTDGQGRTPAAAPRVPVLWILTKPLDFDCPWGDRARLERKLELPVRPQARAVKARPGGRERA